MFEANTNTAFPRGIKFVQIVQPAVECEQNTHCRYNSLCSATAVLHAQTQINTCTIHNAEVGGFDVIDYDEAFTYLSAYDPSFGRVNNSIVMRNVLKTKTMRGRSFKLA